MLTNHMDDTIYFEGTRKEVQGTAEYRDLLERIRAGKEKRRVVFLGWSFESWDNHRGGGALT